MPMRLLTRLDAAIAAAPNPFDADCLRAERACYLARQGHFDAASKDLEAVRRRYEPRPNPAISAWLSLADGLMSHFSDLGSAARDKMRRAHALSAAGRVLPLHALSSAWLAHMDYSRLDIDSMARHLSQALQLADAKHHAARARASLVAGLACHFAGRLDLARPWYASARSHANAEGDDATISAIMYNMASTRAANLRQAALSCEGTAPEGEHALMGADSSINFDQLVGVASLKSLLPLLRAQILALQGDPAQALALYEVHLPEAPGIDRLRACMLSDQAWCRTQVGQGDAARADAIEAEACLSDETQIDDRAAAHSRLAQVFTALGDAEAAQRHAALAALAWQEFRALQARIVALLSQVGANGPL
jgi:tetratricopeptide (TPR) repeat protein